MKTQNLLLCSLFIALTSIGAFIHIPFLYADISLQFLFTAMSGILLGKKYGTISQTLYVLLGLCGVPIFTNGGGFNYIFYPTFGYIVGLIPCVYIIGFLCEKECTSKKIALGCILGLFILYFIGVTYMAFILDIEIKIALISGMLIYLPGDIAKIIICSIIGPKIKKSVFLK